LYDLQIHDVEDSKFSNDGLFPFAKGIHVVSKQGKENIKRLTDNMKNFELAYSYIHSPIPLHGVVLN
jgi:hypothetical protein